VSPQIADMHLPDDVTGDACYAAGDGRAGPVPLLESRSAHLQLHVSSQPSPPWVAPVGYPMGQPSPLLRAGGPPHHYEDGMLPLSSVPPLYKGGGPGSDLTELQGGGVPPAAAWGGRGPGSARATEWAGGGWGWSGGGRPAALSDPAGAPPDPGAGAGLRSPSSDPPRGLHVPLPRSAAGASSQSSLTCASPAADTPLRASSAARGVGARGRPGLRTPPSLRGASSGASGSRASPRPQRRPRASSVGPNDSGASSGVASTCISGAVSKASSRSSSRRRGGRPQELAAASLDAVPMMRLPGGAGMIPQDMVELYPSLRGESAAGRGGRRVSPDPRLDPSISPRRAARILANRIAAAKSKNKKREQQGLIRQAQERAERCVERLHAALLAEHEAVAALLERQQWEERALAVVHAAEADLLGERARLGRELAEARRRLPKGL